MSENGTRHDRLDELLAAAQLHDLSTEEQIELEELLHELGAQELPQVLGDLLVMLDQHAEHKESMPDALAITIAGGGRAAITSQHPDERITFPIESGRSKSGNWMGWVVGLAALITIGTGIFAYSTLDAKRATQRQYQLQAESLQAKIDENKQLLDRSRVAAADLRKRLDDLSTNLDESALKLAESEQEKLDIAQQLADATTDLRDAQLKIAKYETPIDPAVLAQRRRQLMQVPDSIQIAWQPFNLPDSPAEQPDVRGDVVWSDEMQEGYIRFVGLEPNDPDVEQYQVWVIDERGMEQKVSGGVFNANAKGEIIVPIEPGIDVGRVALFAITIENPGGTWVPDLSRRVVVAPRDI